MRWSAIEQRSELSVPKLRDKQVMKIKDLPAGTVTELCRYLNIEGDGQRNWKELVTRIPGRPRIPCQLPYRTT